MIERPVTDRAPVISRRWSVTSKLAVGTIVLIFAACLLTLPYTFGSGASGPTTPRRFDAVNLQQVLLPPFWVPHAADEAARAEASSARPWLGTDRLGRDLLVRCLAGGGISLGVGLAAAAIAVIIGTLYGSAAGASGGRTDALMMRIVDVVYGLPSILLVVLLAVAVDGLTQRWGDRIDPAARMAINVVTLLAAIGGVSWLTMARVIRGQVLSLKQQPFMEASRAIGVSRAGQFLRHLLPNLLGPIIVYSTLTVPTAILSESFLSFLGIGIREPLPSWGNLAADGLGELNPVRIRWWLLLWPCLFIAITLLALNFVGESLRERFDPKRRAVRTA